MSLFGKKHPSPAVELEDEPAPAPQASSRPKYGIDEAIQLMRTLPLDQNPELIVLVVKNTLASMNVSLKDTVRDAVARQEAVRTRIEGLKANVGQLEEQIQSKKEQVASAEAELRELVQVTERLENAVGAHEPTITPPGVVVRAPASVSAPRPPVPVRSKPPAPAPRPAGDRDAIELRDSAIELEPASKENVSKSP